MMWRLLPSHTPFMHRRLRISPSAKVALLLICGVHVPPLCQPPPNSLKSFLRRGCALSGLALAAALPNTLGVVSQGLLEVGVPRFESLLLPLARPCIPRPRPIHRPTNLCQAMFAQPARGGGLAGPRRPRRLTSPSNSLQRLDGVHERAVLGWDL